MNEAISIEKCVYLPAKWKYISITAKAPVSVKSFTVYFLKKGSWVPCERLISGRNEPFEIKQRNLVYLFW